MTNKQLLEALRDIDTEYILSAAPGKQRPARKRNYRVALIAATMCWILLFCGLISPALTEKFGSHGSYTNERVDGDHGGYFDCEQSSHTGKADSSADKGSSSSSYADQGDSGGASGGDKGVDNFSDIGQQEILSLDSASGYKLINLDYDLSAENPQIHSVYSNGKDKISITSYLNRVEKEVDADSRPIAGIITAFGEPVELFSHSADYGANSLIGYIYTENRLHMIVFSDPKLNTSELGRYIKITAINELTEN